MTRWLFNKISWIISQCTLALICMILYKYLLIDLFTTEISYIQWISIIIIATCIFPSGSVLDLGPNDIRSPGDKINEYVNSLIKKKNR